MTTIEEHARAAGLYDALRNEYTHTLWPITETQTGEDPVGEPIYTDTKGTSFKGLVVAENGEEVIRNGRLGAQAAVIVKMDKAKAESLGLDSSSRLIWDGYKEYELHANDDPQPLGGGEVEIVMTRSGVW